MSGTGWILIVSLCEILSFVRAEPDKTNWSIASKYHWGMFEACNQCGKPPYHLQHAKLTWVGDGPKDCYGDKVRFICDCEDGKEAPRKKYMDIWEQIDRREVSCQPAGSWSNSPAYDNPCPMRYCREPKAIREATFKITKHVPAHPDIETPDIQGKYCPGSTVQHTCNECYSGGGKSDCEDANWLEVSECIAIPGCKKCEYFDFAWSACNTNHSVRIKLPT